MTLVLLIALVCLLCSSNVSGLAVSEMVNLGLADDVAAAIGPSDGWGFEKGGMISGFVRVANMDSATKALVEQRTLSLRAGVGCPGGLMNLTTPPLTSALALVLRKSHWTLLRKHKGQRFRSLCLEPVLASFQLDPTGAPTAVAFQVRSPDQIVLVAAVCERNITSLTLFANVSFVNPGGTGDSIERIPLFGVNLVFTYVFFVLFVCWSAYLAVAHCYWHEAVIGLQLALLLSIFVKALESIVVALLKDESILLSQTVITLSEALFLGVQFLMCAGWSLLASPMPRREKNVTVVLIGIFVGMGVLHSVCISDDDRCSAGTKSTAQMIYRAVHAIFMLFCGFTLNALLEQLRKNLAVADEPEATIHFLRVRAIRFPYVVSLPIPLFVYFLEASVLTWRGAFLTTLISHMNTVYIYICIMVFFRPGLVVF